MDIEAQKRRLAFEYGFAIHEDNRGNLIINDNLNAFMNELMALGEQQAKDGKSDD